jgi:hypothetical protein
MVFESVPVEDDLLDSLLPTPCRYNLAEFRRRLLVLTPLGGKALFITPSGDQGHRCRVVDHLSVNVIEASVNAKARTLCRSPYFFSDPILYSFPRLSSVSDFHFLTLQEINAKAQRRKGAKK